MKQYLKTLEKLNGDEEGLFYQIAGEFTQLQKSGKKPKYYRANPHMSIILTDLIEDSLKLERITPYAPKDREYILLATL